MKGFRQKKGVDFDEIFAPVVKMTSIRTVLSIAATMNLETEQLDVKTTFLHGDLEDEIHLHATIGRIRGEEEGAPGMPVEEEPVRTKASSPTMIPS